MTPSFESDCPSPDGCSTNIRQRRKVGRGGGASSTAFSTAIIADPRKPVAEKAERIAALKGSFPSLTNDITPVILQAAIFWIDTGCAGTLHAMATGSAPALSQNRAVFGPASTQGGFQFWYLACLPDRIIAVRQGIGAFFLLSFAYGEIKMHFGLLGLLVGYLVKGPVKNFHQKTEMHLRSLQPSELQAKGNVVYSVSQLKSITCQNVKRAFSVFQPKITIEMASGKRQTYLIPTSEFESASRQLQQLYPHLFR